LKFDEFRDDVVDIRFKLIGNGFESSPVDCFIVILPQVVDEGFERGLIVLVEKMQIVFLFKYF